MTIIVAFGLLTFGLIVLVIGARLLVDGASNIAAWWGISQLVIGLTVVSFGTSAPELAVSISSALNSQPEVALGNVIGSNICNILLIIGLSAMLRPLKVSRQLIIADVPLMIGISAAVFAISVDEVISRFEGICLFGALLLYIVLLIKYSPKSEPTKNLSQLESDCCDQRIKGIQYCVYNLLLIMAGLVLLVLGGKWCVKAAVDLAHSFGVSELVIGLTIVALGTSLPEVATSVVAAFQKKEDIALGNVIGSNIFNLLSVLGLSAAVSGKLPVSAHAVSIDMPIMLLCSVLCLPIFITGRAVSRFEGVVLLIGYVVYVTFLYSQATIA